MVCLACLVLPGSPAEVMYLTPPMRTKITATMPAMPKNHWMVFVTMVLTSAELVMQPLPVVKSQFREPPFPAARMIRMVLMMAPASMVMARPMKACVRVRLPAATLPASPPESI